MSLRFAACRAVAQAKADSGSRVGCDSFRRTHLNVHRTPLALLAAPTRHVVALAEIGSFSAGGSGVRSLPAREFTRRGERVDAQT